MAERVETQIKKYGTSPMNAFLPRFLQNGDCLLCFGNNAIQQADDSGRSMVIDFLAPPTQEGFYDTAAEASVVFGFDKIVSVLRVVSPVLLKVTYSIKYATIR